MKKRYVARRLDYTPTYDFSTWDINRERRNILNVTACAVAGIAYHACLTIRNRICLIAAHYASC
jgi:hypothetical protein